MNELTQFAPGLDRIEAGSLYPHQADGVAYLLSKKRVILADDMGLGKTRQAIVAMEAGAPEGKILVVFPCPTRTSTCRNLVTISSGFGRLLTDCGPPSLNYTDGPLLWGKTRAKIKKRTI